MAGLSRFWFVGVAICLACWFAGPLVCGMLGWFVTLPRFFVFCWVVTVLLCWCCHLLGLSLVCWSVGTRHACLVCWFAWFLCVLLGCRCSGLLALPLLGLLICWSVGVATRVGCRLVCGFINCCWAVFGLVCWDCQLLPCPIAGLAVFVEKGLAHRFLGAAFEFAGVIGGYGQASGSCRPGRWLAVVLA